MVDVARSANFAGGFGVIGCSDLAAGLGGLPNGGLC